MKSRVIQKNVNVSHRKAKLVVDLIRNKNVNEAIRILDNTNKKSAPILKKLLLSAIANSTNNHSMNAANLYVYEIFANQGPTLKRTLPRAKGSADRIFKRTTHLEIILSDDKTERNNDLQAIKDLVKRRADGNRNKNKTVNTVKKTETKKVTASKKPATAKPAAKKPEAKKATVAKKTTTAAKSSTTKTTNKTVNKKGE